MRLRPRTIRTQLLALLLVPMVSLAALWTYGSYTTLSGAFALIRVDVTDQYYGTPADRLTHALQAERKAAVEYDASNGTHGAAQLKKTEADSDAAAEVLGDHLRRRDAGATLNADQNAKVGDVQSGIGQLTALRATVNARNTNWSDVLDSYSAIIDPDFRLRSSLTELQTGEVARKGSVVIELARARELLSQEDAMVLGGREANGMTDGQYRDLIGTIDGRQLLHQIYEPELPLDDGAALEDFENGSIGWSLFSLEEAARAATPLTVTDSMPEALWQRTVDTALGQLAAIDRSASGDVDAEAHNTGMQVLDKSAGVLLAGLLAVIASLLISLRIGRRIAARLTGLRDTAEELSGRRLPEMMRRLREGDPVEDVAATAWPANAPKYGAGHLEDYVDDFGDDEIGQVGRAFGVAQRAAVQAAVEQARLRRGVAAVFTTLARRSQVLLHRQLALLDTMERRNQDPTELADLFRLDHMTNRMRRHAEGLLILSGLTPGRAWRRPVRMAEVVRAAVGEVESYERIVVRPMAEVALVGAAVADVLHLLAELMENATSFSPPDTEVVVNGDAVAIGYVIEIEDRGLGMNPERLSEANQAILDAAGRVADGRAEGADLPETDRLGLFTVGRLAARHGVRVTLRRTTRDGTVAVVLLPESLLVAPQDAEPEVSDVSGVRAGMRAGMRADTVAMAAGRALAKVDDVMKATGATRIRPGRHAKPGPAVEHPVDLARLMQERLPGLAAGQLPAQVPGRRELPAEPAAEQAAEPAVRRPEDGDAAAAPAAGRQPRAPQPSVAASTTTAAGLPRRVPARSMSPRLREEAVAHDRPTRDAAGGGNRERSPEAARSIAAAYASGLARGRADSAATQGRDSDNQAPGKAPEVTVEDTRLGETARESAIEKAVAGNNATEEDGGPTS